MFMAFKDLMVHVDETPENEARIKGALEMAGRLDAHLAGVYAMHRPYVPAYAEAYVGSEIMAQQRQAYVDIAQKAKDNFMALADRAGVRAEWLEGEGETEDVLGFFQRYADLMIMGQPNPDEPSYDGERSAPDQLVTTSGRPVLVTPYVRLPDSIGTHIMVAWDGSSVSSRAVHDAMPLIERASMVTVLEVSNEKGGRYPGADIARHLARHGVRVEANRDVAGDINIAETILNNVSDSGADLLVMGAYSHSRWTEMILGGVTRELMKSMTVPVFMSH